jgi:hypothetical protein
VSTWRILCVGALVALAGALFMRGTGAMGSGYPVIAAAGDIACDPASSAYESGRGTATECRQLATSRLLVGRPYAAVLTLGDNQYDTGAYAAYRVSYGSSWGRVRSTTKPAPGNHEYETSGASGYFRYFGKAAGSPGLGYYSFDIGAWHLVSLNSNCWAIGGCGRGSPEELWLRRDLATHRTACTLAYWHHPRFSPGLHGSSPATAAFWKDLYAAGADVVLAGHDHDYERFAPLAPSGKVDPARGLGEFVVGTGGRSHYGFLSVQPGSQAREATSFGILALTLRPVGYDWRFVPAVGSYSDSGSASCH